MSPAHKLLLFSQHTDNFKRHFKCNLQECDTNYERNSFEESLLLSVRKAHSVEREVVQIPQTTATFMAKQRDAKLKGPKVGALKQRSDMVMCQVGKLVLAENFIDHFYRPTFYILITKRFELTLMTLSV